MTFTIEPAAVYAQQLNLLIIRSTQDIANEWFFYDGAHCGSSVLEQNMSNTWLYENFITLNSDGVIVGYFEGVWMRPMDIITSFRMIHFSKQNSRLLVQSFFAYLDYLFVNRGCQAFNWTVAHLNVHAMIQYDRFTKNYCGHKVGIRHYAQKSYAGKISDISLYEITKGEYFEWKSRGFKKRSMS